MRVRNEVILGLLVSTVILGVATKAVIEYRGAMSRAIPEPIPAPSAQSEEPSKEAQQTMNLTEEEVSRHSAQSDCWIIIDGNVYSVTAYLSLHPGGTRRIGEYCGKDASIAFATRGGKGLHSAVAKQLLSMLKIGALGSTTDPATVQSIDTSVGTEPIFRQSGEEDDD